MSRSIASDVDDRVRNRLRRAGRRVDAANKEQSAAVAELKSALQEADGNCSAADAADLTGMPTSLVEVIQPDLRAAP